MVVDYDGYKALFASDGNNASCIELVCMAHARRKFFDGNQASGSSMALVALQRIGKLYAIAAEGKDLCVENRQQLRLEKSQSALQAWHE